MSLAAYDFAVPEEAGERAHVKHEEVEGRVPDPSAARETLGLATITISWLWSLLSSPASSSSASTPAHVLSSLPLPPLSPSSAATSFSLRGARIPVFTMPCTWVCGRERGRKREKKIEDRQRTGSEH